MMKLLLSCRCLITQCIAVTLKTTILTPSVGWGFLIEGKMKPYLIGLLILTVAIAYSQETNIIMKYVRPWEKDQPARTNVFTVIVK